MFDAPSGWLKSSLPKIENANRGIFRRSSGSKFSSSEATRTDCLKQIWISLTGEQPEKTRLTIIVPVHNEARILPSFLGALLLSELPSGSDIQVIFVVNATSDQSLALIVDRLSAIDISAQVTLPRSLYDSKLSPIGIQFRKSGLRFLVVETPVQGKANALNIGNEIACRSKHQIAISIDANNWVEPDSIALLYACARENIETGSNAVIFNVNEHYATRNQESLVPVQIKTQKAEVTGWMFAWSTHWVQDNHGFPQQAIEDYGVGLMALSQDRAIAQSKAHIWGYAAGDSSDEDRQMIRFLYGAMQLAERFQNDPLATKILLEDFPNLRPLGQRFEHYLSGFRNEKKFTLLAKGMYRWLRNELLVIRARWKFMIDPTGQTWDPIRSTKFGFSTPVNTVTLPRLPQIAVLFIGKLALMIDYFLEVIGLQ